MLAMASKMQLKIKTKSSQFVIDSLTSENTIGELKATIWSVTQIHPDSCQLLIGFPPERLFLVDDQELIKNIIKNSRETLILDESSGNGTT